MIHNLKKALVVLILIVFMVIGFPTHFFAEEMGANSGSETTTGIKILPGGHSSRNDEQTPPSPTVYQNTSKRYPKTGDRLTSPIVSLLGGLFVLIALTITGYIKLKKRKDVFFNEQK